MTEAEWRSGSDRFPLLTLLQGKATNRKLRLFACACVREIWHLLPSRECQSAVLLAEQNAEGFVTDDALFEAGIVAEFSLEPADYADIVRLSASLAVGQLTGHRADAWQAVYGVCDYSLESFGGGTQSDDTKEERTQCDLLRDIFGNPFRPVSFDAEWRTSTAVALAKQMYESRDFSTMPILADALQDAGCNNEDILSHCRDANGVHVRGCWVVDLVLGKE